MVEALKRIAEWLIEHTVERSKYWAIVITGLAVLFSALANRLGVFSAWQTGLIAFGGVITVATGIIKIWEFLEPRVRRSKDLKTLTQRLGAELYSAQDILEATRDYIQPDFQSVDPSGGEDFDSSEEFVGKLRLGELSK